MVAIDLSKQQALDADPKTIQQIDFKRNISQGWNADGGISNANITTFSLLKKQKKPFWIFHKELWKYLF